MGGKHNQVLNFNNVWNDYLGPENDFLKPCYSLTLFEARFRHLLGALPACNAFFEFLCGIFAFQKFYKFYKFAV